ncbi:YwaF family protein [Kurthia sibirica]|uniref:YwaF family protein n=1 Tax=Kurthia sibirica TaxID=202750 RepID=UPI001475AC2C|nr:TIGR02206 family membrane protein [Kurthia sibirica]
MNTIKNGFTLYDQTHFTWLLIITGLIILGTLLYKRLQPHLQTVMERCIAWFLILFECYKNYYLWQHGDFTVEYLPFHLCSLAMFAILWNSYFHDKTTNEFLYSLCLPAGIAALLFANWTDRPVWSFMSFFSFIFHTFLIMYPVMRLAAKKYRPAVTQLWRVVLLLILIVPPIYLFNKMYHTNFLFINTPSPGSPLVPLEALFGNPGYIIALIGIVCVIWIILYLPFMRKPTAP